MYWLVVDPEADRRNVLVEHVASTREQVKTAEDLGSALAALQSGSICLMFWGPPVTPVEAVRLCRALREQTEGHRHLILLTLSHCEDPERIREVFAGGADQVLFASSTDQERSAAVWALAKKGAMLERFERSLQVARTSEQWYRRIVGSAVDGIWQVNLDLTTSFVNAPMARILGAQADELFGVSLLEFIEPADREMVREHFEGNLHKVAPTVEWRLRRSDGVEILAQVTTQPVLDELDRTSGFVALVEDVTERRQLQLRLQFADRMATVGTLAAGVAHEINNPLAFVSSNLSFLEEELASLEQEPSPDRVAELEAAVRDAREGAERVRVIIRDLKTFSRSNDDQINHIDVREVLDASLKLAENELRHRARLEKVYDHDLPFVAANASRLAQAFLNLLINAAQAIPEGQADQHQIRVSATSPRLEQVEVAISDSGTGIPGHLQARIFDPFFTTKPVGTGTGLGLSICHGIVTGLGGEIRVESSPGQGSIFRVLLPAAPRTSAEVRIQAEAPPTAELADRRAGINVLVIDDEASVGNVIRRILPEHNVTVALGGRAGMELCTQGNFEVVLCDVMMPDTSGPEVYEAIRRSRPGLEERFVFMTGGAFTPSSRAFLQRVANPRIDKPFDLRVLRSTVSQVASSAQREKDVKRHDTVLEGPAGR